MHDHDTYDAADNSSKSYALAIRTIRLDKIRLGLIAPRPDDAELNTKAKIAGMMALAYTLPLLLIFALISAGVYLTGG